MNIFYDSLNRTVHETQNFGSARYITHTSFKSLPITGLEYPNGRDVVYNYDELYRLKEITDGSAIAQWSFYGPGRVAEQELANGLTCTYLNNARTNSAVQTTESNPAWGDDSSDRLGYDGAGRTITKRYVDSTLNGSKAYDDATAVVGFTTAYDLASNKRYERHLHAENRSHLYPTLDSMNRLREYQRGTLLLDPVGGYDVTVSTPITLPGTDTQRTYRLDGLGNWQRMAQTPVGGSETTEVRRHNAANQVTKFGTTDVKHDASPYGRALCAVDPTAYWRLGEALGIVAADQRGDHDGEYLPNSGGTWTGGILNVAGALAGDYNTAATFNGNDNYVSVSDDAALDFSTAMTTIVWVKGSAQDDKTVAAHWDVDSDNRSWRLCSGTGSGNTNKIQVDLTDDGTFDTPNHRKSYRSSITVLDGNWHMVAFTFNSGVVRLFVDGVEDVGAVELENDTFSSLYASTAALTLAAHLDTGSDTANFTGTLDEIAVFDSALTLAQINELYRIGQATLTGPAGNGNIVNDGTRRFVYDAFNRVKEVYKESGTPGEFTVKIAAYTYDALGRRIRMETTHGGLSGGLNDFMANYYYDGAQCIEEQDSSHDPYRQYVWGQYVDELIQQREINVPDIDHYMLSDLLYRAVALTNASAEIQEACDCDAYGNTIVYEAAGAGGDWFADDARSIYSESPAGSCCPTCEFIFTGRRFDPETSDAATQMYYYRARYYSPVLGRFISRDPIDYAGGMNLYEYVGSNPLRYHDFSGLKITHYDCCTDPQKKIIKAAHDAAEKRLEVIKAAIVKYTYEWVFNNYILKKGRTTGGELRLQKVWSGYRWNMLSNIRKMQDKFTSGIGVECEDDCKKGVTAYVYPFWSDIHFCPDFFKKQTTSQQGSTFIHELSHLAAGTDDRSLVWTRKAGWFTSGGWRAKDAADDAYWFGGSAFSLYNSKDLYQSHEMFIWSMIWPKAK